jgi:zinc transport system substrate-binding protein
MDRQLNSGEANVKRAIEPKAAATVWVLVVGILAVLAGAYGCKSSPPAARPVAVATIFAYYDALRAIGGPDVQGEILLPPRQSPHGFEPGMRDKVVVARASLIVKNGLMLDAWADKLMEGNPSATVLDIGQMVKDKGIQPLHTEETSVTPAGETRPGEAEDNSAGNPHIWLDPRVQAMAAEAIRDALIKIDPAHKAGYESRAKAYLDELAALDNDFAEAAKTFTRREFIGFHSAYAYLANRYGLKQVASVEELPDQGPSLAQQANIIKLIREKDIKVIFTESALPARTADRIIEETGAKTAVLQPLETYDRPDQTYISLMRENLQALKAALN